MAERFETQHQQIQAALRAWYVVADEPGTRLDGWLLTRDRLRGLDHPPSPAILRRATNEVLLAGLDELGDFDSHGARILRERFLDLRLGKEVAKDLKLSLDQVNRQQAAAGRRLTEIIIARETALATAHAHRLEAALPPAPYAGLFGLDALRDQITTLLRDPSSMIPVAIAGMGGLGKTALADAVARQLARAAVFEGIVWLRAPGVGQSSSETFGIQSVTEALLAALFPGEPATGNLDANLTRLRDALQRSPHLVVVDNLETPDQLADLLDRLRSLSGPSRVLLTTRSRPAPGTQVQVVALGELAEPDGVALALEQAGAGAVNATAGHSLLAGDAAAIYGVVGGNPLALKLAVGLSAVQPLDALLRDLRSRQTPTIDDLYRHIYWQVWNSLSANSQALLLTMPLVAEAGAAPEQLLAISGFTEAELWTAIHELWSRALLEVRGTVHDKRYGIHRLTETFVQTDLTGWANRPT